MVTEIRTDHESDWAAMTKVAELLGVGTPKTIRKWCRQAEVDAGQRPGMTTEDSAELGRLKRENAELKRANAILKSASVFFAAELDQPLSAAVRGKVKKTTISDPKAPKPLDLVDRNFAPLTPDRLGVADFTYCSTWSGWCYTAFVIDAYARRILGWSVATTMTSQPVVDTVEQANWTRQREART